MKRFCIVLTLIFCLLGAAAALAADTPEVMTFKSVSAAVQYVKENKPAQLNLGKVKYKPTELLSIKNAMPKKGKLYFSTTFCKAAITQNSKSIDLNGTAGGCTVNDLEALIALCPKLKQINTVKHRGLSNDKMIPLVEKYPDVEFIWLINLAHKYVLPSNASAFSTFKKSTEGYKLKSRDLEVLKYAKNLKAIDFGHHAITSLDFLQGLDLEMVILAHNDITDLTVLGTMEHLQYAELFMNEFSDVSPLANCKELLDLNICSCSVSDLSPLKGCAKLERLWASNNRGMKEDTQKQFIQDHPDCLANFTAPHATADDWRKHPRYTHYIPCLKSQVWVPFE